MDCLSNQPIVTIYDDMNDMMYIGLTPYIFTQLSVKLKSAHFGVRMIFKAFEFSVDLR